MSISVNNWEIMCLKYGPSKVYPGLHNVIQLTLHHKTILDFRGKEVNALKKKKFFLSLSSNL